MMVRDGIGEVGGMLFRLGKKSNNHGASTTDDSWALESEWLIDI